MAKRNYKWYKLDNAATIVPSTARGSDTRVFRIVCELNDEVDKETLQNALDMTMDEFPHFNVVLRKGLFWYYLDSTDKTCEVTEDSLPECAPMYFPGRHNLLYRVTYFKKRINLEMFHALADGTGAITFLKALVINYLNIAHSLDVDGIKDNLSTAEEKQDDAFKQFYSKEKFIDLVKHTPRKRAYQIRQYRDENLRAHLIEGSVMADKFMELSHELGTTAGILSVSLFIEAIIDTMPRSSKKPVIISVPVNLRQYFSSATTRNFFGVVAISYDTSLYDGTIQSITSVVKEKFKAELDPENIRKMMNGFSELERNLLLKMVPLFIKDPIINFFVHNTKLGTTATLSNLGKIEMPEELSEYIDSFSAFMSTPDMQICVSTYNNKMVFGSVSAYTDHSVLVSFFRKLSGYGMDVTIGTNDYDVEE